MVFNLFSRALAGVPRASTTNGTNVNRRGVVVITTAQLHSTKPELRSCAGSNPACNMLEIRNGEDLWQWSWLEIKLNAFHRSTIHENNSSSSFSYSTLSLVPWPDPSIYTVIPYSVVNYFAFMVFFINGNHTRPSCCYKMVCLYSEITRTLLESFSVTTSGWCSYHFSLTWVPFAPEIFQQIRLSSVFGKFTYNVVNCLISPTAHSAFRFLWWFASLSFN